MRVVALAPYPERAPSTRFRLDQFVKPLAALGIRLRVLPFFSPAEYETLYLPASPVRKAGFLLRGLRRRVRQIDMAEKADLVLVHRELAPLLTAPLLARLQRVDRPLVFDFDDSVFFPSKGGNRLLRGVKDPRNSTLELCRCADLVLAGNAYLADFAVDARRSPRGVRIFPTVIDTHRFMALEREPGGVPLTVGWIGTHSTLSYLESLFPALCQLAERISFRLLVVANRRPTSNPGFPMDFLPWSERTEREAMSRMHVGIYPLPEDPWTLGKCGFKAIQYMAGSLPVVASPVGVLKEIVLDGETGVHATTQEEWARALERILKAPETQARFGAAGRERVVSRYSVQSALPNLVGWLEGCRDGWLARKEGGKET